MTTPLDNLRQRIQSRHQLILADEEARHQKAMSALDALAQTPESEQTVACLLDYLDVTPRTELPTASAAMNGQDKLASAPLSPAAQLPKQPEGKNKRAQVMNAIRDWRTVQQVAELTGLKIRQVRGVVNAANSAKRIETRKVEGCTEYRAKVIQSEAAEL